MHLLSRPRLGSSIRHGRGRLVRLESVQQSCMQEPFNAAAALVAPSSWVHLWPQAAANKLILFDNNNPLARGQRFCPNSNLVSNMRSRWTALSGSEISGAPSFSSSAAACQARLKPNILHGTVKDEEASFRGKLKVAIRDYGGGIFVFHILMSLLSLGSWYLLVSSGLDLQPLVAWLVDRVTPLTPNREALSGVNPDLGKYFESGSTFLIAYTLHKLIMPLRIMATVTLGPLVVTMVRYRTLNIAKVFKIMKGFKVKM